VSGNVETRVSRFAFHVDAISPLAVELANEAGRGRKGSPRKESGPRDDPESKGGGKERRSRISRCGKCRVFQLRRVAAARVPGQSPPELTLFPRTRVIPALCAYHVAPSSRKHVFIEATLEVEGHARTRSRRARSSREKIRVLGETAARKRTIVSRDEKRSVPHREIRLSIGRCCRMPPRASLSESESRVMLSKRFRETRSCRSPRERNWPKFMLVTFDGARRRAKLVLCRDLRRVPVCHGNTEGSSRNLDYPSQSESNGPLRLEDRWTDRSLEIVKACPGDS